MSNISASLVRDLRERTGAGMMDCKKALVEAGGDIEAAIQAMRESGQAKAVKKAGRTAADGAIVFRTSSDNKQAVLLEINCETDFVSRDENFKAFADSVAEVALQNKADSVEALAAMSLANGETIEAARLALVSKIGENIQLRRIAYFSTDGLLAGYSHGGRIGVVIELNGGDEALAKDLAMHIAASNPQVVSPESVSQELIDKEREIFIAQAKESGKPDDIIEKMVTGRVKKFLDEVSLVGQPFVKDPNTKVSQLLSQQQASVAQFQRFEVGEGIEKETVDFADEVMAQVKG